MEQTTCYSYSKTDAVILPILLLLVFLCEFVSNIDNLFDHLPSAGADIYLNLIIYYYRTASMV